MALSDWIAQGLAKNSAERDRIFSAGLPRRAGMLPPAKPAAQDYRTVVVAAPGGRHSPWMNDERIERLFDRATVRQAVEGELRRLSNGKLRWYVGQVANELGAERPGPGSKWVPDAAAAAKLRQCNDPEAMSLGLHWHADPNDPEGGALMLKPQRQRCWLRICPRCSKDHAARLRKHYEGRIAAVLATKVPGCSLKHLTLTLPRSMDLRDDLRRLHKYTKQLIKHFWGNLPHHKEQGAFATAEIGPRGGNVHAHVIVYGRYAKQEAISDYWRKITGDAFIVWIKRISPSAALREGLKYITKLGKRDADGEFEISPAALAELHMALKGRRRVWCWGAFYDVDLVAEDADCEPEAVVHDEPPSALCRCGDPMIFITVPEARAWLHLKGANKCRATIPLGLDYGAGIGARAGPGP